MRYGLRGTHMEPMRTGRILPVVPRARSSRQSAMNASDDAKLGAEAETNGTTTAENTGWEVITVGVLFASTLVGNVLLLVALVMERGRMTRLFYFIGHCCVADLITAFFTDFTQMIWKIYTWWYGGNVACKLLKYLQVLGMYLSSYVFVMMSLDRYQAICHPMSYQRRSYAKWKIATAWFLALMFSIPQLVIFSAVDFEDKDGTTKTQCYGTFAVEWGERAYVTFFVTTNFFVPLVVVTFSYVNIYWTIWTNARRKEIAARTGRGDGAVNPRASSSENISKAKLKTAKLTTVVIGCYIVCSAPFSVTLLWIVYAGADVVTEALGPLVVSVFAHMLALNSSVNPWIYMFFNRNLLRNLGGLFACVRGRGLAAPARSVYRSATPSTF
ncbi:unnamed protein product [Darwinula stevensoni]|uniref:G-protein coupled receptors family 1 profile domain-containing protein n=1 Tax=Darwinula stevensoni TaxID=69355 RepID=A0A7R9AB22_9CRUS|nr:unnamed protein product [Darwinula stevensoni]CAG0898810.1 unnamed protein product [Darwinula stevensoni]